MWSSCDSSVGVRPRWTAAGDSCGPDVSARGGSRRRARAARRPRASPRSAARTARKSAAARDVVDAQDVRAGVDAVADRRERPGEPLARARGPSARRRSPCARPPAAAGARARAAPPGGAAARSSAPASWRSRGPGRGSAARRATPCVARDLASARRGTRGRRRRRRRRASGSCRRCFGAARVCMSTSAAPVRAQTSASVGIAQAADVVDDHRAGLDRRRRNRGLVRVDRHDRAELAGEPPHERHDALDLLRRGDRRAQRDARLAADVDDVGARLQQLRARGRRARRGRGYAPASENESGDALTMPMSHGRSPSASVRPAAASACASTAAGRCAMPCGWPTLSLPASSTAR